MNFQLFEPFREWVYKTRRRKGSKKPSRGVTLEGARGATPPDPRPAGVHPGGMPAGTCSHGTYHPASRPQGIPPGCLLFHWVSGGVARPSLNHRLIADMPQACGFHFKTISNGSGSCWLGRSLVRCQSGDSVAAWLWRDKKSSRLPQLAAVCWRSQGVSAPDS